MNIAAEIFPPGDFLKEELEARGWSQTELAEIIGRPPRLVNEIISGRRAITPETAVQLGDSLGTSAELWMNLESQYQLSKVRGSGGSIARRAQLHERFPIREMLKRGWLQPADNVDVMEQQVMKLFGLASISAPMKFAHAAKKADSETPPSMHQMAWLCRARSLLSAKPAPEYRKAALAKALTVLTSFLGDAEQCRHVGRVLGEAGVRFLVLESLPGSKIDGACFWLDNGKPAIVMSLRLDRIDNFWFVLRHEIEHVLQGHGKKQGYVLDQEIEFDGDTVNAEEFVANSAAAQFCVPQDKLLDFIDRVAPYFSEQRVVALARQLSVHPGLVVGQLPLHLHFGG